MKSYGILTKSDRSIGVLEYRRSYRSNN